MAVTRIDVETFLSFNSKYPVLDVRSEGEYLHAHIPGAVSMPLFNNEERRIVGTAYKQQSKQDAIKIGLSIFGGKMVSMIAFVEKIFEKQGSEQSLRTVVIHCWRGGMRSGGVSWLLDLYGFKVYTIIGGYKAFRQWGLKQFTKDYKINILGGYTGSGKTKVLQELKNKKQVVIDLEDLAKHKGSAFGSIGMPTQPSQEMFENLLALELKKAKENLDIDKKPDELSVDHWEKGAGRINDENWYSTGLWMEDESQRIGLVNIPINFFKTMRNKPVYFLRIPFEERLKHIVSEYGKGDPDELAGAIMRIQKRLGGLEAKTAIECLNSGRLTESFRILLRYYDKQYLKGLYSRENLELLVKEIECETVEPEKIVNYIFNTKPVM